MTDLPRTFTAPIAGAYHITSDQEPHLVQDCTDECSMWDGRFVAEPGGYQTVELATVPASLIQSMNSGTAVMTPADAIAVSWNHE